MSRHSVETQAIDKIVGNRIHELRLSSGLSRQQLADKIGVTHQQLQKYEKGTNRISVGRLVLIARGLNEPVTYFINMLDDIELPDNSKRLVIEVSRNFAKIKNVLIKYALANLIAVIAKEK